MSATFTIFVCSTFSDLSQEREGVLDAIQRLKLQHDPMEFFGACAQRSQRQKEVPPFSRLAKGIDPQQKTAQVDPTTAKLIPSEVLPQELQKVFPEGFIEGTVGALLADFLQNHASNLTARGYQNYRDTTRTYLAPVFKVPLLQFGCPIKAHHA